MEKGILDPENYMPEEFDIITSFEVIEHINNPIHELNSFHKLLRKGGLVYVTTPNFNSVFIRTGFNPIKIESTGVSISRLKKSNGFGNQKIISPNSDDEKIRNQIENKKYLQALKKIINSTLTIIGKGDALKGWFIKD